MSSLIALRDVSKTYRMGEVEVHALRGLHLEIPRGQFVVLLGPSGSGKTTTLNLLGGLDRPTSGQVLVEGEDITQYDDRRLTAYRAQKVGFVFQFFNLIPTLTAAENIAFALELTTRDRAVIRRRTAELLALVGLEDRGNHFPSQLSGGEQQRVAIARALAGRPSILLADEPTGNLDVETGRQVLRALRDLNREAGVTVVLVTHNTAIAPMADRIVRLHSGTVAADELVSTPQAPESLNW
ncbi:MAG TPA: ABC transporter ATP-binding protein [Chloroflexi bacterium]|nr:ABC transporter ATP-binding protein [Chloroflexota bacterium]